MAVVVQSCIPHAQSAKSVSNVWKMVYGGEMTLLGDVLNPPQVPL